MSGTRTAATMFAACLLAWGVAGCEGEGSGVVPAQGRVATSGGPAVDASLKSAGNVAQSAAPTPAGAASVAPVGTAPATAGGGGSAVDERRRLPASGIPDPGAKPVASRLPARKSRPRAAGELADITFDDLKFEMKTGSAFQRSLLTAAIEQLGGTRVRIRGYMLPSFQQSGITQFVLVRDNMQCCFGPGAALYDCVVVDMQPGKSTDFSVRPVAVEGTFSINELKGADGTHLAIYHLVGERVTAP